MVFLFYCKFLLKCQLNSHKMKTRCLQRFLQVFLFFEKKNFCCHYFFTLPVCLFTFLLLPSVFCARFFHLPLILFLLLLFGIPLHASSWGWGSFFRCFSLTLVDFIVMYCWVLLEILAKKKRRKSAECQTMAYKSSCKIRI